MSKDYTLAVNDIRVAKQRGEPIYEVKHCNTTLEMSPRLDNIRKAVGHTLSCTVYRISPSGNKSVVAVRVNKEMVRNDINLRVEEAA
jgi:hypothetical protein